MRVWEESDIASWMPKEPLDLIFSNAALHWLADHETLLPRLLNQLSQGGILAIQMPRNFNAPAHRLIRKVAEDGPWSGILAGVEDWNPPLEPAEYYAILAPCSRALDFWETEYVQVMESAAAIGEWMKGSTLRPFLQKLSDDQQNQFMACYLKALGDAYLPQEDGRVVFPFKRIFIIAER